MILRNENYPHKRITVPNHKEIARGTLRFHNKTVRTDFG